MFVMKMQQRHSRLTCASLSPCPHRCKVALGKCVRRTSQSEIKTIVIRAGKTPFPNGFVSVLVVNTLKYLESLFVLRMVYTDTWEVLREVVSIRQVSKVIASYRCEQRVKLPHLFCFVNALRPQ